MNNFTERRSGADRLRGELECTATSAEAIATVQESVQNNPPTSIRHRSQKLRFRRIAVTIVIHIALHLFPSEI